MSTLIFGHKNPDTDSVCSSIAYSKLKNILGYDTVPVVLDPIKNEAQFVLEKFGFETPIKIDHVKNQIKDIPLYPSLPLDKNNSFLKAIKVMEESGINTVAIVDDKQYLTALITIKDIALELVMGDNNFLNSTVNNLLVQLEAKFITKPLPSNKDIQGKISIASDYFEHIDDRYDNTTIAITGDIYKTIDELIDVNAKLIIICSNTIIPAHIIQKANGMNVPIIQTIKNTYEVSQLISQCNSVKSLMKTNNLIKAHHEDILSDFKSEIKDYDYRNYPVIDSEGKFLGFIDRKSMSYPTKKQVILVDHNESSQSAKGLEEADILEILDHHKLGGLTSSSPINFLNIPVGSTCTIVYLQYKNFSVSIPRDVAGLLISGILSDTLYFKSPTSTKTDIQAVKELNVIAQLDLDKHFDEMYSAASSMNNLSPKDILFADSKEFINVNSKFRVAQFFTSNIEYIHSHLNEFIDLLQSNLEQNNYSINLLVVTDIVKEGSYIFYASRDKNILENAFGVNEEQGMFVNGVVSRKKQIIPFMIEAMNNR